MSRRIAVVNAEGESDSVIADYEEVEHNPLSGQRSGGMGSVEFSLSSTSEPLNLESASRFEDLDGESYYVEEDRDKEWLSQL
ncbi:hypothetical protein NPJ88_010625 [Halomonas elongata]|uniref:hypothetical protein n=1 Tax=Halomonas elongata TaxID=2746 RepID=UPI00255AB46D|nr:hypothetical protein [Halomonas elongata]MDL4862790.1 hypothetical protein [Halomonas elongata]